MTAGVGQDHKPVANPLPILGGYLLAAELDHVALPEVGHRRCPSKQGGSISSRYFSLNPKDLTTYWRRQMIPPRFRPPDPVARIPNVLGSGCRTILCRGAPR